MRSNKINMRKQPWDPIIVRKFVTHPRRQRFSGSRLVVSALFAFLMLFFANARPETGTENIKPSNGTTTPLQENSETIAASTASIPSNVTNCTSTPATTNVGRPDCVKAAIEQFPPTMVSPTARKYGAVIIHFALCIYSFIGLAIACDDYFVSSLDRICEEMKLTPDVAGATFMAAGSSAPELATVIIGVFLAQDDIGVSGVIGSAVFNIMFVIAMCGLFASSAIYLNWWPLCRDSFFYTISIIIMLISIWNERVNWFDSTLLLVTYVVYCVCLAYNESLEAWVRSFKFFQDIEQRTQKAKGEMQNQDNEIYLNNNARGSTTYDANGSATVFPTGADSGQNGAVQGAATQYYKPKERDPNYKNPLEKPVDLDGLQLVYWHLAYPIHYMCQATMPDCRTEAYKNWYPLTFLVSMFWISIYSYIMVWMITIIGFTFGIPDTVMGLTFVAAGVSVPDALTSIAVIKEGYGDMAVSNAVGSNVFDILVCLGLPWFIKTVITNPGSTIKVYSKGLTYSTVSLLSTVVVLIVATHWNGWKVDKRYGVILMIAYFIFLIVATFYELNIFGEMNLPVCPSEY